MGKPKPFNFYQNNLHFKWCKTILNNRGNIIDHILTSHTNISLLNKLGIPTHINSTHGTFSVIDLSLCSSLLAHNFTWLTHPDPCDSDHFPILISNNYQTSTIPSSTPKWKIDKANWPLFSELTNTSNYPSPSLPNLDIPTKIDSFTQFIIHSAEKSIPQTSSTPHKRFVPWWSDDIKSAIKNRQKALHKYQSSHLQSDFINYKKLRAKARFLVRSAKKRSWIEFVTDINKPESCSTMWSHIQRLSGTKCGFNIPLLNYNNSTISNPTDISNSLAEHFSNTSSDKNYNQEFLQSKHIAESSPVQFHNDTPNLPYNLPITPHEVYSTIKILLQEFVPRARPNPSSHAQTSSPFFNRLPHCNSQRNLFFRCMHSTMEICTCCPHHQTELGLSPSHLIPPDISDECTG